MSLDMGGHIDDVFESVSAIRYSQSGGRDSSGRWVDGVGVATAHKINLQPLSEKEVDNLGVGAERINDFRKVYVNDGDLYSLTPQDEWEFDSPGLAGARFTVYMMDNRPWRNYCKCVVYRNDR